MTTTIKFVVKDQIKIVVAMMIKLKLLYIFHTFAITIKTLVFTILPFAPRDNVSVLY